MDTKFNKNKVDLVIYHDPCADGMGAAFIVWYYMMINWPEKDIEFFPTAHYTKPPDVTGKNVLIVDFSYNKQVIEQMIVDSKSLLIIDHHKSAEAELSDIPDDHKIFMMDHSGAMLTWMYYFPTVDPPLIIQYVEDRDIWTNKLPLVKEYAAWFFAQPLSFELFQNYMIDENFEFVLQTKGRAYRELNDSYISDLSSRAAIKFVRINRKYYFIASVNSVILKSDIGNKILDVYPNCSFSLVHSVDDRADGTSMSLRSSDQHVDVSTIATQFGGGGHRNASGVKQDGLHNSLGQVIENRGYLYKQLENVTSYNIPFRDETLKVCSLNLATYKQEMGQYLLQTRYENDDVCIQEASHLLGTDERFDMSVIYSHVQGFTNFSIKLADHISDEDKAIITAGAELEFCEQHITNRLPTFL